MIDKYFRFCVKAFRLLSYALGSVAILLLVVYVIAYAFKFVYPIYFNYESPANIKKNDSPHIDQKMECINKNEPKLLKNLITCWHQRDTENTSQLISKAYFVPVAERSEVMLWLRSQIDMGAFSKDEKVYLTALNLLVATEVYDQSYLNKVSDRAYLNKVIQSDSINKYLALRILGYYRDDNDVPIFIEAGKSTEVNVMIYSIESLIKNCSPKARLALSVILTYPNVRDYLKQNQRDEKLTIQIENRCPQESTAYID